PRALEWGRTPPTLAALTRYNAIVPEASGTRHSRSARHGRLVQCLLHRHTNAFDPRRFALSQGLQDVDGPAGLLPPPQLDRPATRVRRQNRFLLRQGEHPRLRLLRKLHSPTPEMFRHRPSRRAYAAHAKWRPVRMLQVPLHSSSLQTAHQRGTIRIVSELVKGKNVSGLRQLRS